MVGQILGLVDKTATQTTGVHLLQTDEIELAQHGRDAIQIAQMLAVWQDMPPAPGQVLAVLTGMDTRLDIVAE